MGWPQLSVIVLLTLSAGVSLAKNGDSSRISFFWSTISAGILLSLLWAGGFFGGC